MIRILFVGDGPRDGATIPHVVSKILDTEIESESRYWAGLHENRKGYHLHGKGKGYRKKLRFAVLRAIDAGFDAVVAVVDRDTAPKEARLAELRKSREDHREDPRNRPTAVGEADPHGDAWLLADPAAIREALKLGEGVEIAGVHKHKDPKGVLDALIDGSKYHSDPRMDVLGDIAKLVDLDRCSCRGETGFGDFCNDVRSELRPLL